MSSGKGRGRPPRRGSEAAPGALAGRRRSFPRSRSSSPRRAPPPRLGASSSRTRPRGLAGLAPRPLASRFRSRASLPPSSSAFRTPGAPAPAPARGTPRCPSAADASPPWVAAGGSEEERVGACRSGPTQAPMSRPGGPSSAAARPPLITGCRHVFPTLGSVPSSSPPPPSLPSGGAPTPSLVSASAPGGRPRLALARTHARTRARARRSRAPALARSLALLSSRPQIRRGDPLNLSILVSGGKETNQDSLSNGE